MKQEPLHGVKRMLIDPSWRKARIAARILLRGEHARLSARDRRLAARFAEDPAMTNRLLGQAISLKSIMDN